MDGAPKVLVGGGRYIGKMYRAIVALAGRRCPAACWIAARASVCSAFVFLLGMFQCATAKASARILTTAREAHSIPLEEAAHGYPVRLRVVVTYYDPFIDERHAALFTHDATGAVFVSLASPLPAFLEPGTLVEVSGVSATGDFAPIVDRATVRVIGPSHLPAKAEPATMSKLLTGAFDGQWVEVEGIVHSVWESGKNENLEIALSDGLLTATTIKEAGVDYSRLIDSRIRLHGNQAPVFNRHLQLTGARLLFPDMRQVQILEASGHPFALPALAVDHVLRFTPNLTFTHRVRVRGRVSLQWPARSLCVEDRGQGLCVQTSQDTKLAPGREVDLVGFPSPGGLTPTLTDATFRAVGPGQPVTATRITAGQGLQGDYDSKLVSIQGKLIGKDRDSKDPTMVLAAGNRLFSVVLPEGSVEPETPAWDEGATLKIIGICSVRIEPKAVTAGYARPLSFRILARSRADVQVLHNPSWWTARHMTPLLAIVLGVAICVLIWAAILRHRVAAQTAIIRRQNATLTELSFQDSLTHLANRRRFDEALDSEFRQAAKMGKPVSLLMMDIDHFKALNDEYGHQQGDDCLARVAAALVAASLRNTDLVARYGGEEFAVILPGCHQEDALAIAERMRAAVTALCIANVRSPLNRCLTISVGAATLLPGAGMPSASLLALADRALYQSKVLGRNRTTFWQETWREEPVAALQEI